MDLTSMWNSFAGQGIMFWSATGAVALGTTLIISAGILYLRKWRHGPGGKVTPVPAATPGAELLVGKAAEPTAEPVPVKAAPEPAEKENSREWLLLLARLRSAADQLEDYRRAHGANPAPAGESPLKESLDGVDYLFRTGTA